MKGFLDRLYSMYGHTLDEYLKKERAKKAKLYFAYTYIWPLRAFGSFAVLLSHSTMQRKIATYTSYLAANERYISNVKERFANENE